MSNIFFVFFFVVFNVSSLLKERLSPEELRELTNVVAAEAKAVVEAEVEKAMAAVEAEVEKAKEELEIKLEKAEKEIAKLKESPKLVHQPAPRRRHLSLQDIRADRDKISFIDYDKLRKCTKPQDIDDLLLILREMRNDRLYSKQDHTDLSQKEDYDRIVLQHNVGKLECFLGARGVPQYLLD